LRGITRPAIAATKDPKAPPERLAARRPGLHFLQHSDHLFLPEPAALQVELCLFRSGYGKTHSPAGPDFWEMLNGPQGQANRGHRAGRFPTRRPVEGRRRIEDL